MEIGVNVAVTSTLAAEVPEIERFIRDADEAVGNAIRAIGILQARGIQALERVGIAAGLVGEALDFAGRANADVSHAALMMQGVHASLHEAMTRLDPQKVSGGKEPPPKP